MADINKILDFEDKDVTDSIIKVIGVGGGGGNAVNHMYKEGIHDVTFVVCNTDAQALNDSPVPVHLQLGTEGLGAGNRPERARQAAEDTADSIKRMLSDGTKMAFITAGMGGGTGTGAAPIIAEISKGLGILTVGVVTKPFTFEGKPRMNNAMSGIARLQDQVDTMIVIPNDKLLEIVDRRTSMPEALKKADEVLQQAVQGITDLINIPGLINLDFADVQTVMKDKGIAHIGIGNATGDDKAIDAMKIAVSSPLLETTIEGATNVLINIAGDVSLPEVHEAASYVQELAGEDANIIFGATYDENATDEVTITVIATGVEDKNLEGVQAQSSKKASGAKAADFAYRAPASKEFSAKEPKFEESGFTIPKPQKEVKDISIPTFLKRN